MKASDPQMTLGPGPCRGTGPFCGFPSVRPRQCQRATWASASEAGPAPSLFLTPFASISRDPDNALCTPRGPAPPGMPSLLSTEPDRGSALGSLLLGCAPLGHLTLQQACVSGGHWSLKETENITEPEKEGCLVATRGLSRGAPSGSEPSVEGRGLCHSTHARAPGHSDSEGRRWRCQGLRDGLGATASWGRSVGLGRREGPGDSGGDRCTAG